MPPGCTTGGSMRFSVTDSEAKMPRSSGQKAMPARAIALDGSRMVSLPRKRMLPWRFGTRPMIDFIVVVLPAPLRPSSVTTSPSRTSNSTPCSTWLSPYQLFRPETSSMRGPQIGRLHLGVLGDGLVIALRQDLSARQHGDAVAQALDHRQIVLYHQDRPAGAHAVD